MENITSIQGKLLYLARQMHAENAINKKEQGVFKDLIFAEAPSLFQAYEFYVSKGTELTLKSDLLQIIQENQNWQSGSSGSKKSSKKGRSMKIIIPAKNIQKMPAEMNRI